MREKRRDRKGRLLKRGERQNRDGRYEYRYYDIQGARRSVYSWRLVETDTIPRGKRHKPPLRELERQIQRDLEDGIQPYAASRMTLNDLFDRYMELKYELKTSTRTNYQYMYDRYVRATIGHKYIASFRYSDIRAFYNSLLRERGFRTNTMETIHSLLHPVFTLAIRDNLIRANPSDGVLADLKKGSRKENSKKQALTEAQQAAFMQFVAGSARYRQWEPLFTVMLGTGCRVGEIIGLRWEDCDFAGETISINHSLLYRQKEPGGSCRFQISTPKTEAGIRIIPMTAEVRQALEQERQFQREAGPVDVIIDGYSNFIFTSQAGGALSPHTVNRAIERIRIAYNNQETEAAKQEQREPQLLPHFSAHTLRHTFCARFCEHETNLKVIQEIMGHASITTTMDVYNHVTLEQKIASFKRLGETYKII